MKMWKTRAILSIFCCLGLISIVRAQISDERLDVNIANLSEKLSGSLEAIGQYMWGDSRKELYNIDVMVQVVLNNMSMQPLMEKQFIDFLKTEKSAAAKQFICRKLSLVGTKRSAGILAELLENKELADYGLYALERIASPAMDKILIKALARSEGRIKIGIINSLGRRRCRAAVKGLIPLTRHEDVDLAKASMTALGLIGGKDSRKALAENRILLRGELRNAAMSNLLILADKLATTGNTTESGKIYHSFLVPDNIRAAALNGLFNSFPLKAEALIYDVICGNDDQLKTIAIRKLSRMAEVGNVEKIASTLVHLKAGHKIELIHALAKLKDASALTSIEREVESENSDVRIAAITALGDLGKTASVRLLAELAGRGGLEAENARISLYRLTGKHIDTEVINLLVANKCQAPAELLKAVSQRHLSNAVEAILPYFDHTESEVQLEAVKSYGLIARPANLKPLINVILKTKSNGLCKAAQKGIVTIARRKFWGEKQDEEILSAYMGAATIKARSALLNIMGSTGSLVALPEIRRELGSKNTTVRKAAIQALASWPDSRPLKYLCEIAEKEPEEVSGILALRGYISLVKKDLKMTKVEKIDHYKVAYSLADSKNEKRLVFSALAKIYTPASLKLAVDLYLKGNLREEAEVAVMTIARKIWKTEPALTKIALETLQANTSTGKIKRQAGELLKKIQVLPKNS